MVRKKIRALYIEDDKAHQVLVRRILDQSREPAFELVTEVLLSIGLERLASESFDVVILDLGLPDSCYMSPAKALRQMLLLVPETPVIVASSTGSKEVQLKMIELGAQDFVVKQDLAERLVDSIRFAIVRARRILKLRQAAMHDDLTGLYNLRGFRLMYDYHHRSVRRSRRRLSLISADVDGLKQINDREGHQEGNEALKKIAEILVSNTRTEDIVSRPSGDEFWILSATSSSQETPQLIERFQRALDEHNSSSGKTYQLAISFGSASVEPGKGIKEALREADRSMYREKAKAKNNRLSSIMAGEIGCPKDNPATDTLPTQA